MINLKYLAQQTFEDEDFDLINNERNDLKLTWKQYLIFLANFYVYNKDNCKDYVLELNNKIRGVNIE